MADLEFRLEHQKQSQWCWAAVAISICRFYSDQNWPSQCQLVNDVFSGTSGGDCCQDGSSSECDMPWDLRDVLNRAKHLQQPVRGVISFQDLTNEIEARRPVAARILLADMTAHFVVLVGCSEDDDGAQWVKVADPSDASGSLTTIPVSAFLNDYKPGANWDQSYFTK